MKNATIYDEMIFNLLLEMGAESFTATEIFRFCVKQKRDIPQSMIYKALVNLVKADKIQRLPSNERAIRYEKCDGEKHIKIICITCSKELKVRDKRIDNLLINIASEHNRRVDDRNLKIYVKHLKGLCTHEKK